MKDEAERSLEVLIEQVGAEDLAGIAASAFEAWCRRVGADQQSIKAFIDKFIDDQLADGPRNALIEALNDYKTPEWAKY